MPIQIGQKPSPTFQQPLELLSDCHRRVESFLAALILVAEQASGGDLDARQREALQAALRYFREAAPKHTADEEDSLFPRLRERHDPAVEKALEKIQALEADHEVAEAGHALVERLGQKWLATNKLSYDEILSLRKTLHQLHSIYQHHIAVEDNEIFPLAAKVLDVETLKVIGQEMAARRGQTFEGRLVFPRR